MSPLLGLEKEGGEGGGVKAHYYLIPLPIYYPISYYEDPRSKTCINFQGDKSDDTGSRAGNIH